MPKIMCNGKNYSMGNGGEIDSVLSSTSENPVQNKVVTEALDNKLNVEDIADWAKADEKPMYTASEVGADTQGAADTALSSAKNYTDTKISDLVNGAPETLDTLKEIADALSDNKDVVEALDTAIGSKANTSDLTAHTWNKNNPHVVTKSQIGLGNVPNVATNDQTPTYTDTTTFSTLTSGEKLSTAFAKIKLAISNLIIHIANTSNPHSVTKSQIGLGNVENKTSATIRSELTKSDVTTALGYTPPTTNTTYSNATTSTSGLMSSIDKIKLDGIASGAQVNIITGVKGNAETTYRTGQVNITPDNIGAASANHTHSGYLPTSGGTMTGALIAQSNNNYATAQTRNVIISANVPSGTAPDGTIWYQYE